ncbi:MAG TPA: CHAT domain-containing tetratricopeptide repeat protein [Thermomicrobiales bacterium]|nr:CHAT domain-containing tetratricopeptide repeat protein [Thermomicrobiales bacterium]
METGSSPSRSCASGGDDLLTLDTIVPRLLALPDDPARRRFAERCLDVLPTEDFLRFLKDEAERYQHIDARDSLRVAGLLILAADLAGRPDHRALGLMARGDALRFLGQFEEAATLLDAAGDAFLALGDEVGWARTRTGWLLALHYLGRGATALAAVDRAREILTVQQQWLRVATLDLNAGWVCYATGRYDRALCLFERAQALYASLGDVAAVRVAWAKANRAIVLTARGDFEPALRLHEEVRQLWLRRGDTASAIRQEHNIAYVYASRGQTTRALRHYAAVMAAHERAGQDLEAAWVALEMLEWCYLRLNRDDEALALAEETLARFERHGTPTEAAKARFFAALARAQAGDLDRALALLDQAAGTFAASGHRGMFAFSALHRATIYLDAENWGAAREEAARARALFAEERLAVRQAQADQVSARAALALGDPAAAEALAGGALAVARDREAPWVAHEAEHVLGRVADARGDLPGALAGYGRAIESIERQQSTLAVGLREHYLADKLAVYEDAIDAALRLGRPELAFAHLERAKSRALVDYLAGNLDVQVRAHARPEVQALLDTLARRRQEHNYFYNRLYGYGLSGRDDGAPAPDRDALAAALAEREREIARILERLALERTEGLDVVAPPPAGEYLPALQRDLDPGAVLLEYYFRADGGAVFVVMREGLAAVPLAAGRGAVARLLQQWQLNLGAAARALACGAPLDGLGRNARGLLQALHRALVAPVAAHLAGRERLIVVPYGPAHAVPFHALHDGERYLLEAIEVSACPSSHLLRLCAGRPRRAGATALVLAHSDGGRLPCVLDEAREVAALFPGEVRVEADATAAALAAAAARHAVLHLAAHGEARLDNPAFAHLKLADGQLTTADVFPLDLRGALVTLSACETGRSVVAGGDELIGLSRGFLHAGAATLVQSLWRVEDGSTARLMARFYAALRAGRPKGAALREAQLGLLGAPDVHPFAWAPFQLIGDSGPLSGPG